MKNAYRFFTFILLGFVALFTSCMKDAPYVSVVLSTWDDVNEAWISVEDEKIRSKGDHTYLYGQSFSAVVNGHSFAKPIAFVDPNDESKGQIIRTYTFDGKTWSYDSQVGNQRPVQGKLLLNNSINELYAYYSYKDAPENDFMWSWELVDPAGYVYPQDDASVSRYTGLNSSFTRTSYKLDREDKINTSENANLTKGIGGVVDGEGRKVNAPILTRRGYKFVGWSTKPQMGKTSFDTDYIQNPEYPPLSSFELKYKDGYTHDDEKKKTTLYAVWYPDYDNGYWAKVDNPYVPDVFDYEDYKELTKDYEYKSSSMSCYTYDCPYYNEVQYPSKGLVSVWANATAVSNAYKFDHDFAVSDNEFTVYTLEKLRKWNNTLSVDEMFSLPIYPISHYDIQSNSNKYPCVPTDEKNYVQTGFLAEDSRKLQHNSWYDYSVAQQLSAVHPYQAFVIANAMTAYYNAHNGNEEDLTYAYRNEDGTPVRTISDAKAFWDKQVTDVQYSYTADLLASGFRLPTIQEWQFASRVVPKSTLPMENVENNITWTNDTSFKGSSFPQFQFYWQPSGIQERAVKYWGNTTDVNANECSSYVWTNYSSSITTSSLRLEYYMSRGFYYDGGYTNFNGALAKNLNFSGLYNMSGNIAELVDCVYSRTHLYCAGGSSAKAITKCGVTSMTPVSINGRPEDTGFRLVRTISHLK